MQPKRKKGRPVRSAIRQNIVELLYYMKEGYGYDIYRHYIAIFPRATMRSIYYHLRKGSLIGEFKVSRVKTESGDFSWGRSTEKTYYALGQNAKPLGSDKVMDFFSRKQK